MRIRYNLSTWSSVNGAILVAAQSGATGTALAIICAELVLIGAVLGKSVAPDDIGFASGMVPILATWRYVLAKYGGLA